MYRELTVRRSRLFRRWRYVSKISLQQMKERRQQEWLVTPSPNKETIITEKRPFRGYIDWPMSEGRAFLKSRWRAHRDDVYDLLAAMIGLLMRGRDPVPSYSYETEQKIYRTWLYDKLDTVEPIVGQTLHWAMRRADRPQHSNEVYEVFGKLLAEKLRQGGDHTSADNLVKNMFWMEQQLIKVAAPQII